MQKRQSLFIPYGPLALLTEFLLNVCATLFAITAYSSAPAFLNLSLAVPAVLLLLPLQTPARTANGTAKTSKSKKRPSNKSDDPRTGDLVPRPFLTNYRGGMMITTVLAILAVDFPIFPRRFAKVETWGTSLMDLGVGSFVFSAGVVSARSLYKSNAKGTGSSITTRLLNATRHSIPLLILGIIRLLSVKGLEYAEHVTEYGVHWNFFFTLAFLPPFVELSDALLNLLSQHPEQQHLRLALTLALIYEIVLNHTPLLAYILISPRGPSLLSKNREGVFSFIGYLSIFLAGRSSGVNVVTYLNEPTPELAKRSDEYDIINRERMIRLMGIAFRAVFCIVFYLFTTSVYTFNLNVSRRLANLPYVLWVVAFNNVQILLCGLIEAFGPEFSYQKADAEKVKKASSRVMRAFNQNGLAIFLIANLLTGLVNLTMNTLDMSSLGAMCILIAYAAAVTGFAMGLSYTGIKIKL